VEWVLEKPGRRTSVVVPEPLSDRLETALNRAAIPVDLYRDLELRAPSVRNALAVIRSLRDEAVREVEEAVCRDLGVRALPDWAKPMLDSRLAQGGLVGVLDDLIALCEVADRDSVPIRMLGF
jgi:hypothetical protein